MALMLNGTEQEVAGEVPQMPTRTGNDPRLTAGILALHGLWRTVSVIGYPQRDHRGIRAVAFFVPRGPTLAPPIL